MSDEFENSAAAESSAQDMAQASEQQTQEQATPETSVDVDLNAIFDAHTKGEESSEEQKLDPDNTAEQQNQDAEHKLEGESADKDNPAEQQPPDKLEAPNTWNKEEKAAWEKLAATPEGQAVQKAMLRRAEQVEEYGKQIGQDLADAKRFGDTMRPIAEGMVQMKPYLEGIQGPDGRPLWGNPQAIAGEFQALAQIKSDLMRSPAQGLKSIINWARQNGLDMNSALADVVQDAANWQDASTVRAQADAERYRQQVELLSRESRQMAEQASMQQRVALMGQQITTFAEAKSADGQPIYPHLQGEHAGEIGRRAGAYMRANVGQQGLTPELFNEAYNAAIWAHEPTRKAEQARLESARVAQYQKNSARAKQAAGLNPRGSTSQPPRAENMTEQELFDSVWDRHHNGA